ncbi:MAG: fatty acid metabolism transcriptional regulator FadR [Thermodesulfobacteriota bacterium]
MVQTEKTIFRPAQFAEHRLVTAILDETYPPGSSLPAERVLAEQLNVTRQTLREVLQRLAGDRWITIQHGKPTVVNHYWREGGLGILKTLVNFTDYLPGEFIAHLLQARAVFMPACAGTAIRNHADQFLKHLETAETLGQSPADYSVFDWELQSLMAKFSDNMISPLILNDFAPVFRALGERYFTLPEGRAASAGYYRKLDRAIRRKTTVEGIVRKAMEESLKIWKTFQENPREQ